MSAQVFYSQDDPPREGRLLWQAAIESTLRQKSTMIDGVVASLAQVGLSDASALRVRLCLDEAITNAIVHGNRRDPSRQVQSEVWLHGESWVVLIIDEGNGFDPGQVPDPHNPQGLMRESGRGLLLMREFMDEVRYYKGGRCLWLRRQLERAAPAAPPPCAVAVVQDLPEALVVRPICHGPGDERFQQELAAQAESIQKQAGPRVVVFDLSPLTYLTDAGIEALTALARGLQSSGSRLFLAEPSELVRQIAAKTHLERASAIHATIDAALAAAVDARPAT